MNPIVSIIMGSTSDLPIMEKTAQLLNDFEIPFEMNALSAHRTPEEVETFAKNAEARGIKVIIAAAGMAAHLPGVIAASTPLPVIGVPINSTLDGMDALLAIVQSLPGNTGCDGRYQRCSQCRYSGCANAFSRRRTTCREIEKLQKRTG